jgi:hypothetical protein
VKGVEGRRREGREGKGGGGGRGRVREGEWEERKELS